MAASLFVPVTRVPEFEELKNWLQEALSALGFVVNRVTVGVNLVGTSDLLSNMIYIFDHERNVCCWVTFLSADDCLLEEDEFGMPFIAHISGSVGKGRNLALAVSYSVGVGGGGKVVYDDGCLYFDDQKGVAKLEDIRSMCEM
ncbi:hypothetical protein ACVWY1_002295 [Pseudomonas sp. TE6288]|uniref:hypothetical protein n=1 Tax=Pseudomonas TaxID=286 RepID=UPI0011B3D65B|nr:MULTISPECIES: hypothetical protein [Pseudomonas]MDF9755861.1 hypothetical protein [Pseudomonas hunanensis]